METKTVQPVLVHVGPTLVLDLLTVGDETAKLLVRKLTFDNPAWKPHSKTIPRYLKEYEIVRSPGKTWIRAPRGAFHLIRTILEGAGLRIEWVTRSVVSRSAFHLDPITVDPNLRPYQDKAARSLLQRVQGVLEIPTGGGKTRITSAALVASGEPGIVFVHSEDLLGQWQESLSRLGKTVRVIQGGDAPASPLQAGEIAVAMIQTVTEALTRFSPLLQSAGVVVWDETHHIVADSWRIIAAHCPARYRWGCTATKDRDDGLGFLIDLLIGPTVFKISTKELINLGYLKAPRVLPVATGWAPGLAHYFAWAICPRCKRTQRTTYKLLQAGPVFCRFLDSRGLPCGARLPEETAQQGKLNYTDAQTDVSNDPGVQAQISDLVQAASAAGRTSLVLVPRTEAVSEITEALRQRGIAAVGVTGDLGKRKRADAIARVRDGTYAAIVATTLADEGLDIPRLDFGINLMSGKSSGRARQRMGRLLRLEGQDPIQVELVHEGSEYERQWTRRMSAYVKEYGKTSILQVTPGSVQDVEKILA